MGIYEMCPNEYAVTFQTKKIEMVHLEIQSLNKLLYRQKHSTNHCQNPPPIRIRKLIKDINIEEKIFFVV